MIRITYVCFILFKSFLDIRSYEPYSIRILIKEVIFHNKQHIM